MLRAARVLVCLTLYFLHGTLLAADPVWSVGPAFEKQLQSQVGVTWAGNPIRAALARLSENQQVAVFLDRRVDPETKVDFSIKDVPLHGLFDRLGKEQSWGVSYVGSVVYMGPTPTARKLATIAELRLQQVAALPEAQRRRFTAPASLRWDELTTPRELVQRVAAESGLQLINAEQIPHDLWPAGSWPALSPIEKLTLILAGFDLTFEIAPDGVHIRPAVMPAKASIERVLGKAANMEQVAKQLGERFPDVKLAVNDGQLSGVGIVEDLDAIKRTLSGERVRPNPATPAVGTKQVYTLNISQQPAGGILKALGKQLDLQVEFDPAIPQEKLAMRISFQVKEVSREELLDAAAKPAGLKCVVEGKTLKVTTEQ